MILNNHNHPSHDFTPRKVRDWLEKLGFETGKDTTPKHGWKEEEMDDWIREDMIREDE